MPVDVDYRRVRGKLNGVAPGVIAAAGNYAALDVISQDATNGAGVHWKFAECARRLGGGGKIVGATIAFSAQSMVARTRLTLFNAIPSASELDDNAAESLDDDDKAKCIGWLDFPALVDRGEVVIAQLSMGDAKQFVCASTDDAIYGVLTFLDAETNEAASMTCDIHLHIEP